MLPISHQYKIPIAEILVRRALPLIHRLILVLVCLVTLATVGCVREEEAEEAPNTEGEPASVQEGTATPQRALIPTRTITRVPTSTQVTSSSDLTATASRLSADEDSSGSNGEDRSATPAVTPESTSNAQTNRVCRR